MTVLVGPNNSGKSLVLREIEAYAEMDEGTALKILKNEESALKTIQWIEPDLPGLEEAERLLLSKQFDEHPYYGRVPEGYVQIGKLDMAQTEDTGGRVSRDVW